MVLGALAVAGGSALVGGLASMYGAHKAGKIQQQAMQQDSNLRQQALDKLMSVGVPTVEAQEILLTRPNLVFEYFPELEQQIQVDESQFADIEVDPRLAQAQLEALEGFQQRASMGLTPEDEAALNALRRDISGQAQARDAGIMQSLERRGMGGSGAEIAQRLASSQNALQRQAEDADRQAAMSFAAKMQALGQVGNLGGQMRSQSLSEQSTKAQGMDAMAQFKAQMEAARQRANVGATNQANLLGAQMGQQHEYKLADLANQQEMYNKALIQQRYQNQMQKAGAEASALTGQAQAAAQAGANAAQNKLNQYQSIGNIAIGAGQIAASGLGGSKDTKETEDATSETGYSSGANPYMDTFR